MSSNYTGNPTAVEAPASAPTVNVAPIAVLPSDGDAASAASIAQAIKVLTDHHAWLMQFAGGTRTAKGLAVDATGGTSTSTTAGNITASGQIISTGLTIGSGLQPSASAGSSPAAATLYKDLVPWAWAKMAWTGSVYSMASSAGFDMTYNGATGWAKLATGVVDFRLLNVPPGGDNGTAVIATGLGNVTPTFAQGVTGSGNPKVFLFDKTGTAVDAAFHVLVFAK